MEGVDIECTPMEEFEFWLEEVEAKVAVTVKKPTTRVEACQLLATTRKLKIECERRKKPDELATSNPDQDDEYDEDDEADPKVADLRGRYALLLSTLADSLAKAETLCVCWNKLDADMSELTTALTSGGAGKLTMDKLESSIAEIKEMFKERAIIIENLTPGEL